MNKDRKELTKEISEAVNRSSLENLVDMNDFTIAEFMVNAFVNLINAIQEKELMQGGQPRADRNAFVKNLVK